MEDKSIRIGLLGAGYFGSLHARNILESAFDFVGFYDPDPDAVQTFKEKYDIQHFTDALELIKVCDAVNIVSPTSLHIQLAELALREGKHIFIEKPLATSSLEAKSFVDLVNSKNTKVQVGHIERFNPAYKFGIKHIKDPIYIESARMAAYNPRANDVSVVYDLMIHDIDAILSLVKSPVKNIYASGISSITNQLDFCEARIIFENGCIANLKSSRMHHEAIRSLRVHENEKVVEIDFLNKSCKLVDLQEMSSGCNEERKLKRITPKGEKVLDENIFNFSDSNAILEEINEFYFSIISDKPIRVDQNGAYDALFIADKIEQLALNSLEERVGLLSLTNH